MKRILCLITMIVLAIIIASIILYKSRQEKPLPVEVSDIKTIHFYYSTGNMMNAWVSYDITKDANGKRTAIIKLDGQNEEDALRIEVDEEVLTSLEEVLKKYEVGKWNNFNKSDPNVLDGNSFSLSVHFEDNTLIDASGYMMYPTNYREVKLELDSIFEKLYNDNK